MVSISKEIPVTHKKEWFMWIKTKTTRAFCHVASAQFYLFRGKNRRKNRLRLLELISHLTVVYCKLRSWKTSALESLGFLFDMQLSVMCLIMKHGQQTFLFLSFVPSRSLFFPPFVIRIKKKKFKNYHLTIVGEISRPKQLDQNFETYLGKPCESLESLLNSV